MDEQEYRKKQQKWDAASLDERIERWKKIETAYYGRLPALLGEYVEEADELYINGHFMGAGQCYYFFFAGVMDANLKCQSRV